MVPLLFWTFFFFGGVGVDQNGLSFLSSIPVYRFLEASIYFDSQSVVDGSEFFKPVSMYAVMAGPDIFQFGTFFNVALSEPMSIFVFVSSSSLCNSFPMSLIHSVFLLCCLRSHILLQILFCFLVVGVCSCILPLLTGRIFFVVFKCPVFFLYYFSCFDIFLVFLLLSVPSDFFLQVVLFVLLVLLFPFPPNIFQRSSYVLSFLLVFVAFN